MRRAFKTIRNRAWKLEDAFFERRMGLDFGPPVDRAQLLTRYDRSRAHAHGYQGVRYRKMRILLDEARKLGPFERFVDIGCGTGKACCIAAREKGFARIVGIDFSAELIAAARRNGASLGDDRLSFQCTDAADYILPEARCLVFLFNPFDRVILARFLGRNRSLLHRNDCAIAYANPSAPRVVEEAGFRIVYQDRDLRLALYRPAEGARDE